MLAPPRVTDGLVSQLGWLTGRGSDRSPGTDSAPLARGLAVFSESHGHRTSVGQIILAADPRRCAYCCGRGRLSDCGIRFVWIFGLLRPKARPMYGIAHAKGSPAGQRTTTKFTGRKRSCRRKGPLGSSSPPWAGRFLAAARDAGGQAMARPTGGSSACGADVDLCSCQRAYYQRSVARQTARERRAAGARVRRKSRCESCRSVAAAAYSGEARAPRSIIQEEKRAFGV
jgi:hypothetical protein